MRKFISLLLVLITVLSPVTAFAAPEVLDGPQNVDGSLRHDVYGDVSRIEVSEELDEGELNEDKSEATLGTDLYLFVDPDTASYVTFYVTDEYGNPIEGALIFIGYKDDIELFGVTDGNGKYSTYLFRDVEYSYKVYKPGYEIAEGSFTATEETKFIRVVLRKYYKLEIVVVDNGVPVPGITVIIDGQPYVTDENGSVVVLRTNGVYNVEVITPDGRRIPVKATVNGDTRIVVDIGLDEEGIIPGGRYQDRFLVFNRWYDPEDYILTKYLFNAEDVEEDRSEAYLSSVRDTVLIEAMCEHEQREDGPDIDILTEDGTPLFTQRSLMPSGFVIRAWENEGFEKLVFTNEEMALRFDLDALHSDDMMKVYGLIWYLSEQDVKLEDISTEETLRDWQGYKNAGFDRMAAWDLELRQVDLDAVKDFAFEFEGNEDAAMLSDEMFINSQFEFRITPITPETMLEMLSDGLTGEHAVPTTDITLASYGFFAEELRRHLAAGKLSEAEYDELYAFFVDGKLSGAEIQALKEKKAAKLLSEAELQVILDAAADEKLYRVSCWLSCRDIDVDITSAIDGLEIIRKVDRQYDELIAQLEQADSSLSSAQLTAQAEKELSGLYDFMTVRYDPGRYSLREYKAGEFTGFVPPVLLRALDEESEFYSVISGKYFNAYHVDVRNEVSPFDSKGTWFRAYITGYDTLLEQSRALAAGIDELVLTALTYK